MSNEKRRKRPKRRWKTILKPVQTEDA